SVRIIDVLDDGFTVALPPAAAEVTARTPRQPGIRVNLELLREPRSPTRERLTSVAATILLAGSLLVFAVGASWWAWAIVVAAAFVSGLAAVADGWVRPIRPRS